MALDFQTLVAAGAWDGSVGAGAAAIGQRGGFFAYGGVGDYDFTLDGLRALDINQSALFVNILALNDHVVRAVHTTDLEKQFLVETLPGVAAEGDINLLALSILSLDAVGKLEGKIVACGSFNGAAGPPGVAFGEKGGQCVGPVGGAGTGLFDITLDGQNAVDATEGIILVCINGATRGTIQVVHTTDVAKRVTIRDGAAGPAAADLAFDWAVIRFAP